MNKKILIIEDEANITQLIRLYLEQADYTVLSATDGIAGLELHAREHPDLGAILFECSMLPPYARAVQDAVGLPVFDFVTMINHLHAATHQQRYAGAY